MMACDGIGPAHPPFKDLPMRNLYSAGLALLFVAGIALAQDSDKLKATVKMVDAERGKMLVAISADGGIRIKEFDLGKDVKFLDEKGKPLKGGLKSDKFKSDNNRPAVPISISFNKDGSMKSIRLTPPPK
jgi:hypothetical protein